MNAGRRGQYRRSWHKGPVVLAIAGAGRPGGILLRAGTSQPLFHVEHAVSGTESQPLNRWRIVHLTDARDQRLTAVFRPMGASPWLAEHTEIYIRDTLGIQLARKPAQGPPR